MRTVLVLSLTPLFASLLSGCILGGTSCDSFQGGTYDRTYEFTPDEYDALARGETPCQPTGCGETADTPTTGDATTGGASTDGASTGGADTDTDTATTGAPLTPDEVCQKVCLEYGGQTPLSCSVGELNAMGKIPIECEFEAFCEGRRHACVRSHGDVAASAAAWLARAAHDETASIYAFLALAAELSTHGAPDPLLARLRDAAADEARHAKIVDRLAREHHARSIPVDIAFTPPRDLLAIAIENAVEGCVRETWAALSAAHQARHAADPRHRSLYRIIAADEARHAELAWAIDAWLFDQLGPADHARIEAARSAAARDLRGSLAAQPYGPELAALGLPDPATARHLAASLDATLWSQAA